MAVARDEWRLIALAALGFMLSMFVLANEPEGGSAASWYIFLMLFWVGIAIYAKGSQGIGNRWVRNAFFGGAIGGAFCILHVWAPSVFNLGFPKAVESVRFIIVGIVAPIGESIAFHQGLYLWVFRSRFNFVFASIATSLVFMSFHYVAYGLGAATAAFLGAFTFSMIACWLTERTKDCVAATSMHAVVNIFLLSSPFVVIGV